MSYKELKDKIHHLRKAKRYAEADQLKHELKKLRKYRLDKKHKLWYN